MISFCRNGLGSQVGTGKVGVAGQGEAGLTIDQKADLGDARQVGVERGANGQDGKGLGLKARGMAGSKGSGEVDDG